MDKTESTTIFKVSSNQGFKVKDFSEDRIIIEGFNLKKVRNPHGRRRHKPFSDQIVIGNNVEFECYSENTIERFNSIQISIDSSDSVKPCKHSNIRQRILAFIMKKILFNKS